MEFAGQLTRVVIVVVVAAGTVGVVVLIATRLAESLFFNNNNGTITPKLTASRIVTIMQHRLWVQHGVATDNPVVRPVVECELVHDPVVGLAIASSDKLEFNSPLLDSKSTGLAIALRRLD